MIMSKNELVGLAATMVPGRIEDMSSEQIMRVITATQYITDLCLNELEARGELEIEDGQVMVPYASNYGVETILTRP